MRGQFNPCQHSFSLIDGGSRRALLYSSAGLHTVLPVRKLVTYEQKQENLAELTYCGVICDEGRAEILKRDTGVKLFEGNF